MLDKINSLKNWQAAVIILLIGFVVFSVGLTNPFQGDDFGQIVKSKPVQSISHIVLLFEGGTFYANQGLKPLEGSYYRPMMTTAFALVYTFFGAHAFYYHLLQLVIYIGSAVLLFLIFQIIFSKSLSLFLALLFLVHPLNTQVVYAIPSMQDALFFFFGILSLYLLVRFKSTKFLILSFISLLCSLLSKETAVLFFIMDFLYLFWWDKKRYVKFIFGTIALVIVYLPLRLNAIGFLSNPYGGQIDYLSLKQRLLTTPSIYWLYITKFIFPWKIATGYYWTYKTFSVRHVLLPLIGDLLVLGITVYLGYVIHKKKLKSDFQTYVFFAIWTFLGLGMLSQIEPLDLTASFIWLIFPIAGFLGMLGVVLSAFPIKINYQFLFICAVVLILLLGFRSFMRGFDYRDPNKLALMDLSYSQDNYRADKLVAAYYINQQDFINAEPYELKAIKLFPQYGDFINLAAIYIDQQQYQAAMSVYQESVKYAGTGDLNEAYDGEGTLTLLTGDLNSNISFLKSAVNKFPNDYRLWMYLGILEEQSGNNMAAKAAIERAEKFAQVPPVIFNSIEENIPFTINLAGQTINIK